MKKTSRPPKAREGSNPGQETTPAPPPDHPPRFAPSLRALAPLLGYSRQACCQWRRLPGAPVPRSDGSHDIEAWRRFIAERGLGIGSLVMTPNREAALARRADLQAQKLEHDLSVARGEMIPMADALAGFVAAVTEFRTTVENEIIQSLPRSLHNKTRAALGRAFDKVRARGRELQAQADADMRDGSMS